MLGLSGSNYSYNLLIIEITITIMVDSNWIEHSCLEPYLGKNGADSYDWQTPCRVGRGVCKTKKHTLSTFMFTQNIDMWETFKPYSDWG